jgi:thioesterase domain-containing protein
LHGYRLPPRLRHGNESPKTQPEGPYLLAGHSFGGWIAHAVGQELRRAGQEASIWAIDTTAGSDREASLDENPIHAVRDLVMAIEGFVGSPLPLDVEALEGLDPSERLLRLKSALEAIGFLAQGTPLAQMRGLVEVFWANQRTRYRPSPTPEIPVSLILARDPNPGQTREEHAAEQEEMRSSWQQVGRLAQVHIVPGDHVGLMSEPHVITLAQVFDSAVV